MKKINIIVIIVLFTVFVSAVHAQTGTITVKVTQIDVKEAGQIKIGIYNSIAFPNIGKEIVGIELEVTEATVMYTFENIPVGRYGIAVFQDKNNDGKLNKNLFGAPIEPYGFSNNKYGMFGPPDFDDISVAVKGKDAISLTINLE